MQPAVGQGALENAIGTHPPIPLAAARGHVNLFPGNAQGKEMASARPGLFPLLPVVKPHSSPDPFRQFQQRCVGVAEAEVVEPAEDVAAPCPRPPAPPFCPPEIVSVCHERFPAPFGRTKTTSASTENFPYYITDSV